MSEIDALQGRLEFATSRRHYAEGQAARLQVECDELRAQRDESVAAFVAEQSDLVAARAEIERLRAITDAHMEGGRWTCVVELARLRAALETISNLSSENEDDLGDALLLSARALAGLAEYST